MNMTQDQITDDLLTTMSMVAENIVDNAGYDRTIEATITDDTYADKGIYTIFYGTAQWEAYTKDTSFKKGDLVQVLIPGNDTRRTKTIIGKVASNEPAVTIKKPFENFIDVTGNLISVIATNNKALLANNDNDKDSRKLLWMYEGGLNLHKYSTIGIEVSFKSIVNRAVKGDYGIELEVTGIMANSNSTQVNFKFSSKDMSGDCYNYQTFMPYQMLFSLSKYNFEQITGISLYFYENNDFYDENDNRINSKDSLGNNLPYNLFIDNPGIYFGWLKEEKIAGQDEVYLEIAPGFSETYDVDHTEAVVNLNWLYWNEDNTRILTEEEIRNTLTYKIEWYYYRIESSVIADLEQAYQDGTGPFTGVIGDTAITLLEDLKASIGCTYINNKNWQKLNNDNEFTCKVQFNINSEDEYRLIAFVFKDVESAPVQSQNMIIFRNTANSNLTASENTNCVKIIAEDGSYGNYYCYTGRSILNNEDRKTRKLKAVYYTPYGEEVDLSTNDDFVVTWDPPDDNTMLKYRKDDNLSSSEFIYSIANIYDITATNNTVYCRVIEYLPNNEIAEYEASFDFNFGQSGNAYGGNTLVIDYVNLLKRENNIQYTRNAIQYGDEEAEYVVRMFDSSNKEIDLMVEGYTIEWELDIYAATTGVFSETRKTTLNVSSHHIQFTKNGAQLKITNTDKFNFDYFYILRAIVTKGTIESTVYYPIAISKDLKQYNHIRGCTSVIYKQIGNTVYDDKEYLIYNYKDVDKPLNNVTWQLIGPSGIGEQQIRLSEQNTIIPSGYFFKDQNGNQYETPHYCIQCLQDNEIIWSQSIAILKSSFESTTVNKWNGHSVQIDEEGGTIAAVMIATGKKESDGTFTGMLMGDITNDVNATEPLNIGLYGFNHGDSTFGLIDDGTAFFGPEGHGRILIDGNKSTIQSAGYNSGKGLFLDLDDAKFDVKNGQYYVTIDVTNSNTDSKDKKAIAIGTGSDPNFSVSWNGDLRTVNGYFQGTIESQAGHIANWEIKENELKSGNMIINSSTGINFNGVFTVDTSGKINATGGKIGGWNISSNSLSSGNMTISSSDGINFNSVFTVDSSGNLTATEATIEGSVTADILIANTSGQIGGWDISADGLTNGIFELTDSNIKFGSNFIVSANGQLDITNLNVLGTLQIAAGVNGRINNFIKIVKFNKRYTIGKNKYKKDLTIAASIDAGYVPIAISRITTGSSYVRPFHFGVKYSYGDSSSGGTADIVIKVSKYPRKKKVSNRQLNVWILLIKGSGPQLIDLLDSDSEYDSDQPEIEDFDGTDAGTDPADGDDIVGSSGITTIKIDPNGQKSDPIVLTKSNEYNKLYYNSSYTLSWLETTVFKNGVEEGESHFAPGTAGYNSIYNAGRASVICPPCPPCPECPPKG